MISYSREIVGVAAKSIWMHIFYCNGHNHSVIAVNVVQQYALPKKSFSKMFYHSECKVSVVLCVDFRAFSKPMDWRKFSDTLYIDLWMLYGILGGISTEIDEQKTVMQKKIVSGFDNEH